MARVRASPWRGYCVGVAQSLRLIDTNGDQHARNVVPSRIGRCRHGARRERRRPVDLSDRGAAARDAMRQRGELLMIVDTEECWPVAAASPGQATVDEIVAGSRPAISAADAAAATRTGYRGIAAPAVPGGGAPLMSGAPVVIAPRGVVGPATQTIPNAIRQNLQGGRGY